MSTLTISSGIVTVERLDDLEDRPWSTVYELTSRRISGRVVFEPDFNNSITDQLDEDPSTFEFLPQGLRIAFGRNTNRYDKRPAGTLHVNGIELVGCIYSRTTGPGNFSVRRPDPSGIYDEPAPDGTRSRTREVINLLDATHRADTAAFDRKAALWAAKDRQSRYDGLARKRREVEAQIAALEAELAAVGHRQVDMHPEAFARRVAQYA
ncbi:hypothetical protein ACGFZ9_09270 [Streptomyces mirabilis]|uniref:hypothetical protein n=1 Tax=Streptomyces mirabilis TaxID=68239 RepID=UPI003715BAA7